MLLGVGKMYLVLTGFCSKMVTTLSSSTRFKFQPTICSQNLYFSKVMFSVGFDIKIAFYVF